MTKRSAAARGGDGRRVLGQLVIDGFDRLVRGDADDFSEGLDREGLGQFVDGGHGDFCGVACWCLVRSGRCWILLLDLGE